MKLLKCGFCKKVLDKNELNYKDEVFGNMCQACYEWLYEDYLYKKGDI